MYSPSSTDSRLTPLLLLLVSHSLLYLLLALNSAAQHFLDDCREVEVLLPAAAALANLCRCPALDTVLEVIGGRTVIDSLVRLTTEWPVRPLLAAD